MDADERDIYFYMKSHGRDYISVQEVCRRVGGKRRFRFNHDWARPALLRMAERGILESDEPGRYRLKPMPIIDPKGKRWAAKEFVELLKQRGKSVEHLLTNIDEVEYYDTL